MGRPRLTEFALLLVAVVCALYGFGPPRRVVGYRPSARAADELRVVTWNIGRADGARALSVDPADGILQRVRDALRELDPDITVLQEVAESVVDAIAEGFPDARTAFRGDPSWGCGIIVQRGRLVSLPAPDAPGGDPVHVLFRPDEGRPLQVTGLNADAWSASRRNQQIGRAVDRMGKTGRSPLHILAGDLNLDVDLGGGKDLFTEDEYLDVQTYNYVAERMHDAGARCGATAEPDRRLDYIFVSAQAGELKVRDAGVWRGQRADGMDHHPLVADIARD